MSEGSSRLRTLANIASSRGEASAGSSSANGSFLMMLSATDSASPVRPSANRQNARYSSACRRTSGALESALLNLVNVDKAASYEADDITVHTYGKMVIVNFRLVQHTEEKGSPVTNYFRNTGTFLNRNHQWQVVAWQATRVPSEVKQEVK